MQIKKLIETLHPYERKVLPILKQGITLKEIANKTGLKEVSVMRALQWLSNKKILKIDSQQKEIIDLDINGIIYLKEGLPEKRLLRVLKHKELDIYDAKKQSNLSENEINVCIGLLKRKQAIELENKKLKITFLGEKLLGKETLEEQFLKSLPLNLSELSEEQKYAFNELIKRKNIIKKEIKKIKQVELITDLGRELITQKIETNFIDSLTPKILKDSSWKDKKFRRYDIKINVPNIYPGKRHFVNQAIEYAKRIWLDLGFKEMSGNILQTSFWNFDALFTAQDHPVRDLQDTFFIKQPKYGKLPRKELVDRIKKTHEYGWTTGSIGWRYKWQGEEAKKNCLRTHTTVLSAKTIANLKESDLPVKYFAIGKCFRNETLDWAHLFEFYQIEGIVVDPDANFKHLIGYLKEFFKKMGYSKVRVRPGYFPYTELSAEVDVFHPYKKEWIELAGSGLFRPEVVKPLLGKDVPVLAWGLGFPRTIAEYYNISDIRDLYKNDLKQIREMKMWLR
jgi:phenylalanyl-tRNA synthetase alpha chain